MPTEYRVVCAQFPAPGHGQHLHLKRSLEKAEQSKVDGNHHAEMMKAKVPGHYYTTEAPYRIQWREVTEWADLDAVPQPVPENQPPLFDEVAP
jgi:hypothetical protein